MSRASAAERRGTTTGRAATASMAGTMPGTGRTEPSSPSSPTAAQPWTHPAGSWSSAASSAKAMARSRPLPTLRTLDGARLTVTRLVGQVQPVESRAARTRSRASRQAVSGSPTMVKPGSPAEACTSTVTGWPSAPRTVAEPMVASTTGLLLPVPQGTDDGRWETAGPQPSSWVPP